MIWKKSLNYTLTLRIMILGEHKYHGKIKIPPAFMDVA